MRAPTPEQKLRIPVIAEEMKREGVPTELVSSFVALALRSEEAYDLMEIWAEADTKSDRADVVADLLDALSGVVR
jgi:hypothetical protein